ncbi:MAG: anthranilate phosphoribosyltransferase, partial [Desulfobacterales bacterium]
TFEMTPEEYDFKRAGLKDIVGGDAKENANITRQVLGGEKGPKRDMVLLNASAAFVATGLCGDFKEGIQMAADSIDSGKASAKLDQLIEFTRHCKPFVRSEP